MMADEFDGLTPQFRRAAHLWPEAQTLVDHYQSVVECYEGNQHALVETVKSYLECVCLTILGEYGKSMTSSTPTTTEILVETLRVLGFQNTRGTSKFDKVLSAHNKLADALSEMRSENGPVAHGKDGFLDALTANHRRVYLLTADTLLALVLDVLEGKEPDLQYTRESYERFSHLHSRIDNSVEVSSTVEFDNDIPTIVVSLKTNKLPDGLDLRIEPSRLLYSIDRAAYIELLTTSMAKAGPVVEDDTTEQTFEAPASMSLQDPGPLYRPSTYSGSLSSLWEPLKGFVVDVGIIEPAETERMSHLVNSLLSSAEESMGTDWKVRPALLARMKVSFRRTLVKFDIPAESQHKFTEKLVDWFVIMSPDEPASLESTG